MISAASLLIENSIRVITDLDFNHGEQYLALCLNCTYLFSRSSINIPTYEVRTIDLKCCNIRKTDVAKVHIELLELYVHHWQLA